VQAKERMNIRCDSSDKDHSHQLNISRRILPADVYIVRSRCVISNAVDGYKRTCLYCCNTDDLRSRVRYVIELCRDVG
jgi:hypothetical protein